MTRTRKNAVALAHELLRALGEPGAPSNDEAQPIDEEALRDLARADAEKMRRARARNR